MINLSFPFSELEYFLLILTRVTAFIYISPFYGMKNVPNRVKIGLGVFISFLLYNVMFPHPQVLYTSTLEYGTIVLKEATTGILIGLGANLCTTIMSFAGRIIDMDIGLSMASQMDPTTNENTTMTGLLYQYTMLLFLVVTGMYRYLLKALVETFTLIPINGTVFNTSGILTAMITFLGDYLVIGFRICLPIFAVITLLNAILGILAKIAPQMNMFSVGIQLKVLTGLSILFVTAGMLPSACDFIFEEMKKMIVAFVVAMGGKL